MAGDPLLRSLGRIVSSGLRAGVRSWLRERTSPRRAAPADRSRSRSRSREGTREGARPSRAEEGGHPGGRADRAAYPGDYEGMPPVSYAPLSGNRPDPGEVVWTWVPYEEDHSRGKDRPVLLVGHDEPWLLGLQLTSVDHDRDAAQEARAGRFWVDVGSGAWDTRGRASEARVNRVIRVDPASVRRVSVSLPRPVFDQVVAAMREHLG